MNTISNFNSIAVLGGTGKEGKGLAYRFAKAGFQVLIGSRTTEKAKATAQALLIRLGGKAIIDGVDNHKAACISDIIVLTVPFLAHRETLENIRDAIQGKLLVDVTVPLVSSKPNRVQMPSAGSAAQEACLLLGKNVQVTTAFQNISHELLLHDNPIECDILVTGTSKDARIKTLELIAEIGLTGWDAGPIENSVVVEGLTSVLININKLYKSANAGIRITGPDRTTVNLEDY
jgi:8-hydroxy-5-deazaflavin:NADPH oxidoreductase